MVIDSSHERQWGWYCTTNSTPNMFSCYVKLSTCPPISSLQYTLYIRQESFQPQTPRWVGVLAQHQRREKLSREALPLTGS